MRCRLLFLSHSYKSESTYIKRLWALLSCKKAYFPAHSRSEECMDDASTIHIFDQNGPRGSGGSKPNAVYIVRPELTQILNLYGKMVAAGEWHDYAIDTLKDLAIFSIFKRASDRPLYRIIKEPSLATKQGAWRITGMDGSILKRGKQLEQLLRYFDRQLVKAVT
mgnify:CR=1 FL=1